MVKDEQKRGLIGQDTGYPTIGGRDERVLQRMASRFQARDLALGLGLHNYTMKLGRTRRKGQGIQEVGKASPIGSPLNVKDDGDHQNGPFGGLRRDRRRGH